VDQVVIKAMAKVNLGLDVLRRLENGYHEVKMVMQTVNLYDELVVKKEEGCKITITSNTGELPLNEDNLIFKAAKLIFEKAGCSYGVSIHLNKNIPIAAGMAGGSTDAAATLLAMNHLFEFGMSKEALAGIGVRIGADVPYCIYGGTYLSEGIGEVLTKLPDAPDCFVVVAKPDISVSTKYVYENLHANELKYHPDIDGMVEAIREGSLDGVCERMENVLETVTETKYTQITELKTIMKEHGAMRAMMSGSGPTVFGLYEVKENAEAAAEVIRSRDLAKQVFVTGFYHPVK